MIHDIIKQMFEIWEAMHFLEFSRRPQNANSR